MLVAERYEKIVQLVNERGSIRVSELSELCQVTEETIRRDLDRLEQAGGCAVPWRGSQRKGSAAAAGNPVYGAGNHSCG